MPPPNFGKLKNPSCPMSDADNRPEGPSFVFIGPPGVGKTVFFTCAVDRLKRDLLEVPGISLQTDDQVTLKRHAKSLADMKKGSWPAKSAEPVKLFYELEITRTLFGIRLWSNFTKLVYHDYPGEVFDLAFGDDRHDSPFESEAETLKEDLLQAQGIFLVIDTPFLHDGANDDYNEQLFCLLKFLESGHPKRRVAVIFTKKDMFRGDPDFNPKDQLRDYYPDAWVFLERSNANYFFVSAVSDPILNRSGKPVPPKGYDTSMSENLIEPLRWALNLSV